MYQNKTYDNILNLDRLGQNENCCSMKDLVADWNIHPLYEKYVP